MIEETIRSFLAERLDVPVRLSVCDYNRRR